VIRCTVKKVAVERLVSFVVNRLSQNKNETQNLIARERNRTTNDEMSIATVDGMPAPRALDTGY
jgi:hypothetical protein